MVGCDWMGDERAEGVELRYGMQRAGSGVIHATAVTDAGVLVIHLDAIGLQQIALEVGRVLAEVMPAAGQFAPLAAFHPIRKCLSPARDAGKVILKRLHAKGPGCVSNSACVGHLRPSVEQQPKLPAGQPPPAQRTAKNCKRSER